MHKGKDKVAQSQNSYHLALSCEDPLLVTINLIKITRHATFNKCNDPHYQKSWQERESSQLKKNLQ